MSSLFIESCIEQDTDYLGHDITFHRNVKTPEDCKELCLYEDKCNFWTHGLVSWETYPGCWLESKNIGRQHYFGLTSGKKICGKLSR